MARKKYTEIPKGSWLDQQGQRWVKVAFDVMSGGVVISSAKSP